MINPVKQHSTVTKYYCKQNQRNDSVKFGQQNLVKTAEEVVKNTGFKEKLFELTKKVLTHKVLHPVYEVAESNPPLFNAGLVLVLATTLRPACILAVPGAKKEDKQYSAARSIATGVLSFAVGFLLYSPLEKTIRGLGKAALYSRKFPFPFKHASVAYKAFNYFTTQGSTLIIAPLQAMLLMKLIPPIVKKIFPDKNTSNKNTPSVLLASKLSNIDAFKKFIGGPNR